MGLAGSGGLDKFENDRVITLIPCSYLHKNIVECVFFIIAYFIITFIEIVHHLLG